VVKSWFIFTAPVLVFYCSLVLELFLLRQRVFSTLPLSFFVGNATTAVAPWGRRNPHLQLGPALPEARRAPPLLVSPMVAGGDQRRGKAIFASCASGA